jgi:TonB family protein
MSQIRKYLAGELDAHAMHQLEREALDDPFLMDAMDGYSLQNTDQGAQLEELQSKLQRRVNKGKVYRMPSRVIITAAASVLVILSITYLLWPSGQPAPVNKTALVLEKRSESQNHPDTIQKPVAPPQLAATMAVPPVADKTPEQARISPVSPANAQVRLMAVTTAPDGTNTKTTGIDTAVHAPAIAAEKNDSNTIMTLAAVKQPAAPNPEPAKMMRMAAIAKTAGKISGMVSNETNRPLAGVSIVIKGKNEGVKTDSKGKFSLPGQDGELLIISFPGYDSKEVTGDTHDSLNVFLRPADQSISEMVAIGFGKSLATQRIKTAHPQIGWDKYNAYLKTIAIITAGKSGTVRLSFTVDGKGQLGNFKVTKTLSPDADEMAVSMVKNGPAWSPDASGTTKTVRLKIEFKRQQ